MTRSPPETRVEDLSTLLEMVHNVTEFDATVVQRM